MDLFVGLGMDSWRRGSDGLDVQTKTVFSQDGISAVYQLQGLCQVRLSLEDGPSPKHRDANCSKVVLDVVARLLGVVDILIWVRCHTLIPSLGCTSAHAINFCC